MLDIREGDQLSIAGADYPIRAVEEWPWDYTLATAFRRWVSVRCQTKRATVTGGVSAAPATYLQGLKALQLTPVDADTRARPELRAFAEVKETYIESEREFYRVIVEVVK